MTPRAESLRRWLAVIGILLGVAAITISLALNRTQTATNHQAQVQIDQQRQASARADCRSEIAALRQTVIDALTDAKDERDQITFAVVFGHTPPGSPLTAEETQKILDANVKVTKLLSDYRALPSLPDAVDHGLHVGLLQHVACPKVT